MLGPPKPRRLDEPVAASLENLVPRDNFYRHLEAKLDEEPAPVLRLIYGEVGTLHLRLDLPVTVVRYPFGGLHELTHAYAISIHKAQGAEFPVVVIPLLTSHAAILGWTLLYTAVTRAKQLAVIVGQRNALGLVVRDWRRKPWHTALAGVLDGTVCFTWVRPQEGGCVGVERDWEGLLAGDEGV